MFSALIKDLKFTFKTDFLATTADKKFLESKHLMEIVIACEATTGFFVSMVVSFSFL